MSFNFRKQLKALLLMNSFIFLSAEFSIADSLFVGKSIKQHSKAASACAWATQNVHRSMSHLSAENVRTHIKRIDGKSSESFLCRWMVAVSSEWSSHVNFNRERWIEKLLKCRGFCAECSSLPDVQCANLQLPLWRRLLLTVEKISTLLFSSLLKRTHQFVSVCCIPSWTVLNHRLGKMLTRKFVDYNHGTGWRNKENFFVPYKNLIIIEMRLNTTRSNRCSLLD